MKICIYLISVVALIFAASVSWAQEIDIMVWAMAVQAEHFRVDNIKDAAVELNAELEKQGDHIRVQGRMFDNWDMYRQEFAKQSMMDQGPDIIVSAHEDIPGWAKAGFIQPFDNLTDMSAFPLNDIYPALWATTKYKGRIWGVPQDAEARMVFYWKPYLKALGYSDKMIGELPGKVENGEYTLYDMLADAQKAQDKGLVKPGYGFYPRPARGPDWWQFYAAFGGRLYDPEKDRLIIDKGALIKYFQFIFDAVYTYKVTKRTHIPTDWNQWYHEVATGQAAIWHGGSWHYPRYIKEGAEDFFGLFQFSLIPAGEKGMHPVSLTHPLVYLIRHKVKPKVAKLAAHLIVIASKPAYNTRYAIESGHLGITRTQLSDPDYSNDRWITETSKLLDHAFAQPNHEKFVHFDKIIWDGLLDVWQNQTKPEDAVADVLQKIHAAGMDDDVTVE